MLHIQSLGASDTDKVLSAKTYQSVYERAERFLTGTGSVRINMQSKWSANTRWSRNEIISSGDSRENRFSLARQIHGAGSSILISNHSDAELKRAVEISERFLQLKFEQEIQSELPSLPQENVPIPEVWHSSTLNLEEEARADIFHDLVASTEKEGMLSAGYIEVSAYANASGASDEKTDISYGRYTDAQLSITVRAPDGRGSGWAGITWDDWSRINGDRIAEVALDKCLRSRDPVAIEPGRYTVILEPQAVHDLIEPLFSEFSLSRPHAEHPRYPTMYTLKPGYSKIGLRLFDPRLRVHTDPYHPDCYYYPYNQGKEAYKKATWVDHGVLVDLSYERGYAIANLGKNESLLGSSSYILEGVGSGTGMSVESMIEHTERGLLVTRFHINRILDNISMLTTGLTRDGLWLIEKGKISKAVKNLRFTESPFFMLNNVLEYGTPARVFSPGRPCLVPAIRAQDFSFTAMIDAI